MVYTQLHCFQVKHKTPKGHRITELKEIKFCFIVSIIIVLLLFISNLQFKLRNMYGVPQGWELQSDLEVPLRIYCDFITASSWGLGVRGG